MSTPAYGTAAGVSNNNETNNTYTDNRVFNFTANGVQDPEQMSRRIQDTMKNKSFGPANFAMSGVNQ